MVALPLWDDVINSRRWRLASQSPLIEEVCQMSENAHRYYRPSNAAPISGIFTMLTVGGLAALVLGSIYALVAKFEPFIVFTIFGGLAVGIGGGTAVDYGARVGKVCNRKVVPLLTEARSAWAGNCNW